MDQATLAAFDKQPGLMQADLDTAESASAGARKVVVLDQQAIGRLSRMDALQGQAMARAQSGRRAVMARRIAAGSFGVCESCGKDIPPRRLDFDPTLPRRLYLDPTLPTCASCASG